MLKNYFKKLVNTFKENRRKSRAWDQAVFLATNNRDFQHRAVSDIYAQIMKGKA